MIRSFDLKCSVCGEAFSAGSTLHYRPNYTSSDLRDIEFICDACIQKWHEKWKIAGAMFHEHDYVMTMDLVLEDGTVYEGMDCTPIHETETVVAGEDIPLETQQELYRIYTVWDLERKKNVLKTCTFNDEGLMLTVTCETYGGEKLEDLAFRFNRRGELQTAEPIPDYMKEQIIEAYSLYEMQLEAENHPVNQDLD